MLEEQDHDLAAENAQLKTNLFVADEIQKEMRQLLANAQFELAQTRALLKLANQSDEAVSSK